MTRDELATLIKPKDEVTTSLGRTFAVGAVHRESSGWWIEPEGADEYTWWVPLVNIRALNGQPVQPEP